jgi:hypothetical protein
MRYHNNRNNGGDYSFGSHAGALGVGRVLDVDLHGQTADTAVAKLGQVLVGAVNTNATGLRVVTGVAGFRAQGSGPRA